MLEILGVLLGLAGVFFMAFLDTCVQRFKDKAAIKKAKEEEAAAAAAGGDPDKEFFEGAPKNSEQAPAANAIQ